MTRVRDIMTTNVVTISLDERLDLVDEIMTSGNIRHIPVTKGGSGIRILYHPHLPPPPPRAPHGLSGRGTNSRKAGTDLPAVSPR